MPSRLYHAPDLDQRPNWSAELERTLGAVLTAVDYGILVTTLDHTILLCNQKFGDLFGLDLAKTVHLSVPEVRDAVDGRIVDRPQWEKNLDEIYADPNAVQEDELELKNPHAMLRRFTGPVLSHEGAVIGRLWTFLDITQRSRRQRLERTTSEAVVMFDSDPLKVCQHILNRVSSIYGSVSVLSVLEGDYLRFYAVSGVPEGLEAPPGNMLNESFCQFCLNAKSPLVIQDCREHPSMMDLLPARLGFTRYMGVPLFSPQGGFVGTLCILDDHSMDPLGGDDLRFMTVLGLKISAELDRLKTLRGLEQTTTQLNETREMLVQSEKLAVTGTLSASIAHDIRNILASMNLQLGIFDTNPQRAIEFVRQSLGRFDILAHRLLSYARPRANSLERLDVVEVIRHVLELVSAQFSISKVELRHDLPDHPVLIDGDEGRLEHLFVNLLMNALQACQPGGWVELRVVEAEGAQIEVSDNGKGIEPDQLERLFEPFVTTRADGFGLGLYSCRQIMETHSGSLGCVSTPGQGTTMTAHFRSSE